MSVATKRTAKYGGTDAQFTTVASPGAALSALFALVDAALLAAGWTAITSPGSPGPNTYSSTGEDGTGKLYLTLSTGACGTVSGTDVSGGSYLALSPCQFIGGTGTPYSQLGAPRLSAAAGNVTLGSSYVALEPSLTWDFAFVCDKDGWGIYCYPTTTTPTAGYYMAGGQLRKAVANPKARFTTTTAAINSAGGSNVVVNVSGDMGAAGYQLGDIVEVVALNAPGSGIYADRFSAHITALTATTVTLDTVPALSANVAVGALIGDDPQPLFSRLRNSNITVFGQNSVSSTGGSTLVAPAPAGSVGAANNWKTQVSTNGTAGDFELEVSTSPAYGIVSWCSLDRAGFGTPAGFTTSPYKEFRSSANGYRLEQTQVASGGSSSFTGCKCYRGYYGYFFQDLNNAAGTIPSYSLELSSHNAEYILVGNGNAASYGNQWMGPFPKVNATTAGPWAQPMTQSERQVVECVVLEGHPCAEDVTSDNSVWSEPALAFVYQTLDLIALDGGATASGDDEQPTLVDRPYAFDGLAQGIGSLTIVGRTPAPGATLATGDAISFTAQYDTGKACPIVYMVYPSSGLVTELIYDGQNLQTGYMAGSTAVPASGGITFSIKRDAGWPHGASVFVNLGVPLT